MGSNQRPRRWRDLPSRHKILILITLFLLLAAGVTGSVYRYITAPVPAIHQQLDEAFGADFFETFVLENELEVGSRGETEPAAYPRGELESGPASRPSEAETEQPGPGDLEMKRPAPGDNLGREEIYSDNGNEAAAAPGNTQDRQTVKENPSMDSQEKPGVPREKILEKYSAKIMSLEKIALERLDKLYAAAAAEYRELNKKGSVDRAQLARKYIQAGERLEKNVDNKFQEILVAMEEELQAHRYSTDIINDIKRAYSREKAETRKNFFRLVF